MLAETAEGAFSRPGWIFELKYDGVRALAERRPGRKLRLLSRNRRDLTASFPEIASALAELPCDSFLLDGEIVVLDERGASSFQLLQGRLGQTNPWTIARLARDRPAMLYCFDLLALAGTDLCGEPLLRRKELLARLVSNGETLRVSAHVEENGTELFDAATNLGLEGIVAKRADSAYRMGRRSPDWLKIKATRTADVAIVGFLAGKGSRGAIGSLMVAWHVDGELVYAGNVGSGLEAAVLDMLGPRLTASRRNSAAFRWTPRPLERAVTFVEPELVAEVRYTAITHSGYLRAPVFLRLREDKAVIDCQRTTTARAVRADEREQR